MAGKTRLPEFRAVIFDMDGLVLDSEPSYVFAWREAADEFGVRLTDEFMRGLFGRHADDVERALATEIGEGFDAMRFRSLAERFWWAHVETRGIPLMPGAVELLELLGELGIPYGLATNSDERYARICLRLGGLEGRFPVLVSRDQVAAGKPKPDLFLEAARRLGIAPSQCLVLEDSATGLIAAKSAGALPVRVLDRPEPVKPQALASFRSLREVAEDIRERLYSYC